MLNLFEGSVNEPADFSVVAGRGFYRPVKHTNLDDAGAMITEAIAHARELELAQLLVDTLGLTGIDPPNTFQRYYLINRWAEAAQGRVQVAMVLRPEIIDPSRFGIRVAQNRGFLTEAFLDEAAAIAWLDAN